MHWYRPSPSFPWRSSLCPLWFGTFFVFEGTCVFFVLVKKSISILSVKQIVRPFFPSRLTPYKHAHFPHRLDSLLFSSNRIFVTTSRELKRIEGLARSPIFAMLSESLSGIATIRSNDAVGYFQHKFRGVHDVSSCWSVCFWRVFLLVFITVGEKRYIQW